MKNIWFLIIVCALTFSCNSSTESNKTSEENYQEPLTYLALGDSYTIGESVAEAQRWPMQLTDKLREEGYNVQDPKIIAETGWRTDNLLNAMDAELGEEQYDLVSVLIGVNNQYQGRSVEEYKNDLEVILLKAINRSKEGKDGVFVLSIPDYGVTPFGQNSEQENISEEIAEFNEACQEICSGFDIPFYNITPISTQAATNENLVANDGLHPSGEMYRLWVEEIFPNVVDIISD